MPLPPPPPPPPPPAPGPAHSPQSGHSCFRHPQRPTERRCTRCGTYACSDCLVQAPVGSNCVDCVRAAKPATATRARNWSARQPLLVTKSLMAINIAIFVWVIVQNPSSLMSRGITKGQAQLGLSADIIDRGVIFQFADGAYLAGPGEWYRIITSGFIHFGLIHIAFNMYLLYLLGQMIEPAIGRLRFTLLYFASLIGGSAGAMILQPGGFHGGASGAVFGLMGAAFIGYRQRGVNPFATGIGTLLLLNLFITFALPGISIGGHLGGVAVGALVGSVVLAPNQRRYPSWFPTAFPAVIIMVGIAVTAVAVAAR